MSANIQELNKNFKLNAKNVIVMHEITGLIFHGKELGKA